MLCHWRVIGNIIYNICHDQIFSDQAHLRLVFIDLYFSIRGSQFIRNISFSLLDTRNVIPTNPIFHPGLLFLRDPSTLSLSVTLTIAISFFLAHFPRTHKHESKHFIFIGIRIETRVSKSAP